MNLAELITAFRVRADDATEPYLWDNTEVALYLNQAEQEAAERALLIQDSTTVAVCKIAITSATAVYPLHTSILKIERAVLSNGDKLDITSSGWLDVEWPGWSTATGTPRCLVDDGNGNVTVVPAPLAYDTITLTVKRLPLAPMDDDTDAPEIHVRHHYRMLDWALRCAYLKQDADAGDATKAKTYEASFERSFGYLHDANVQRKHRDKKPNSMKSGW